MRLFLSSASQSLVETSKAPTFLDILNRTMGLFLVEKVFDGWHLYREKETVSL
jgi:hypothetical protein